MKGKLSKSKSLSRKKQGRDVSPQDDANKNEFDENDKAVESEKVDILIPKSKCLKTKAVIDEASSYDYTSDDNLSDGDNTLESAHRHGGLKRKRLASNDGSMHSSGRFKKLQQAINDVKKTDKTVKKRKVPKSQVRNDSTDVDDLNEIDKKPCFNLSCDDFVKLPTTRKNSDGKLQLKKSKATGKHSITSYKEDYKTKESSSLQLISNKCHSTVTTYDNDEIVTENQCDENQEISKAQKVVKCPVCKLVFDQSKESSTVNEHVNNCIDGQTKEEINSPVTVQEHQSTSAQSSLSILQDQLIAFEYQNCKTINQDVEDGNTLFFCHICQKELSKMNTQRRQQHINRCCDSSEESQKAAAKENEVSTLLQCPFCSIECKSRKSWQMHIKRCAQHNNIPLHQLIEVKNQHQLVQAGPSTLGISSTAGSRKPTLKRKTRHLHNLRNIDEETQLAMALSASMVEPPPVPDKDVVKRKKQKRKKENEVIPALLLRSKEETLNVIAARASELVLNKDNGSDDEDIPCTPALAPSSLAQQYTTVDSANQELTTSKGKPLISQEVKMTDNDACDPTLLDTKLNNVQSDKGIEILNKSCEISVAALSEMVDNYEMCKSFLSFLDDMEDDKEGKTSRKNKEKVLKTPLWSLASLNDSIIKSKSFYVSGLLPTPLPKQPRKSPMKSWSKYNQKVPSSQENKTFMANIPSRECVTINESKTKNSSEGNITRPSLENDSITASQAVNVDILLQLADSCSDNEEESQRSQRNSSIDFDEDDNVFPSSGFCVPVGPATTENDSSLPASCLNTLLKDLYNMVGNASLSDVVVVTKGNQEIPAHSFILASRSQILADMIATAHIARDGQEAHDKPVCLIFDEFEPEIMRCVLEFIYTAKTSIPAQWMNEIITLAQRFKLVELENLCQASKEISDGDEKHGEGSDITLKAISAEELLDSIWQKETGESELQHNNQQISQDNSEEGFDEDDIEEVRIFQTQSKYIQEGDVQEDGIQEGGIQEGDIQEGGIREGDIQEGDIQEGGIQEGSTREGDIQEGDIQVQEGGIQEGDILECHSQEVDFCGDFQDKCDVQYSSLRDSVSHNFETCDVRNHKNDIRYSDQNTMTKENDVTTNSSANNLTNAANISISEHPDKSDSIVAKINLAYDELPELHQVEMESAHAGCSMYQDIEDDIEEHDVAMMDQTISLLSDDDDGGIQDTSQELSEDVVAVIPETPHPKRKAPLYQLQHSSQTSQSSTHSAASYSTFASSDSDDGSEEDGTAFLAKLRENTQASRSKGRKKRKTKISKTDKTNTPSKESEKTMASEEFCHSISPQVSPDYLKDRHLKTIIQDASDIEEEKLNQTEDLMNENAAVTVEDESADDQEGINQFKELMYEYPSAMGGMGSCDEEEGELSKPRNLANSNPAVSISGNGCEEVNQFEDLIHEYPITIDGNTSDDEGERGTGSQSEDLVHEDPITTEGVSDVIQEERNEGHAESGESEVSSRTYSPARIFSPSRPCYSDYDQDTSSTTTTNVYVLHQVTASNISYSAVSSTTTQPRYSTIADKTDIPGEGIKTSESESEMGGFTSPVESLKPLSVRDKYKRKNSKTTAFSIDTKKSLFQRLKAKEYGIDKAGVAESSGEESDESDVTSSLPSQQEVKVADVENLTQFTINECVAESHEAIDSGGGESEERDVTSSFPRQQKIKDPAMSVLPGNQSQDFRNDGGHNLDAGEFAAYLQDDDSFMANAIEQMEHQGGGKEAITPIHNKNTMKQANSGKPNACNKNMADSPGTPLLDYNNMDTPDLRTEIRKYGVRPLPKKKMVAKLNEIQDYLHPGKSKPNPLSSNCPPTSKPAPKPRSKAASQNPVDSDEDSAVSNPNTARPSKVARSKTTNRKAQPKDNCKDRGSDSRSDGSRSAGVASEESDNEEEEFGEVSFLIDSETVTASQQTSNNDVKDRLQSFITSNQDIYLKVLHYQPIDLMALHALIKSHGIQCSVGKLLDFLDEQCISFTTAGQKPRRTRRKPSRRK